MLRMTRQLMLPLLLHSYSPTTRLLYCYSLYLILIDAAHDKTVDATTSILSYSPTTRLLYCYSLYLILIDAAHDNAVDFGRAQPAAGRHQLLPDYIT
jgi:hypothetical protein